MKKLFFNSILVILLIAGCEEESIVKNNLQSETEKEANSKNETLLKTTNANSLYFVDRIDPKVRVDGVPIHADVSYHIIPNANWNYNSTTGKITATGTVDASFYTMYGDTEGANSYIEIQFFLEKNSNVYNESDIFRTNGVKGNSTKIYQQCNFPAYYWVTEESASDFRSYSYEFSVDDDLRDVTIVSQGYMMGCFNKNEDCLDISLEYANDISVLIDNTMPGTVFIINAIEDTSVNENSSFTSLTPSLSSGITGNVTYTLGGADAADFTIDAVTGIVSMIARDYENPVDANTDNVYELTITATDGAGNFDVEALTVTINDVIEIANFSINEIANTNVDENSPYTSATPVLSGDTPIGSVTYTKGGADAADFTINATTGVVSMVARDYENPVDANTDNVYELTITATDEDGNSDNESWTVTIDDVYEPPLPMAPRNVTIDKVSINISWDSALYAESYNVFRLKVGGEYVLIGTTTSTNYTDYTVLPTPDTYMFIYDVQSENETGVSILKSKPVKTMGDTYQ